MGANVLEYLDEATRKKVEELLQVTREKDGSEKFISAQINIGDILLGKNLVQHAIEAYSNVQRLDNATLYAVAQFNIGDTLYEQGKKIDALVNFRNIQNTDNSSLYAATQYFIGKILFEIDRFEEALKIWSSIKRSDNSQAYAEAQFNIGFYLKNTKNLQAAISAWDNIKYSDDKKLYSHSQFYIGCCLFDISKHEEAILAWNNIRKNDDSEAYAKAQLRIGSVLMNQEDYQKGLMALCNVERKDDLEAYARAQFKIANYLMEAGYLKAAALELEKIDVVDDVEAYTKAQFNLGILLRNNGDIEESLEAFRRIKYEYSSQVYAKAQYAIGEILINDSCVKDYNGIKESFELASQVFPYEARCYMRICELLNTSETKKLGIKIISLLNKVLRIVNILTLDFNKYADEEKPFERKLAHYTSTYVCNSLIGNSNRNLKSSFFRLNTINNVNDPSEGQLLFRKLKGVTNNKFDLLDFDEEFHAFISCFTFNHDSLNQFRLYGKENDKEASGMSLVFEKEFFKDERFIEGISYLYSRRSFNENDVAVEKEIAKHPVMRCVYLDPTSDYIHLAQRNRLTFFREFGSSEVFRAGTQQPQAEYEWNLYEEYISKITDDFKLAYDNLKSIYKEVEKEIENIKDKTSDAKADELTKFADEILLPLKYLVKHSAFQEEQECRMIYITSFSSKEVIKEYGNIAYIEYEPNVKDHLNKIYIAPAAIQHKRYFEYILGADVPVEVSGNVFR